MMPQAAEPAAESSVEPRGAAPAARHVFVYGTLRRGGDNDITRLAPAPRYLGPATLRGTLYHLGRYPGVRLDGDGVVQGEVYEVAPALERILDEIEEVYPQQTNEYAKRECPVALADGRTLRCFVYEIAPGRVRGCPVIASGDWVRDR